MIEAVLLPRWWFILFSCSYSSMLLDGKRFSRRVEETLPDFLLNLIGLGSDYESATDTFCDLEPVTLSYLQNENISTNLRAPVQISCN